MELFYTRFKGVVNGPFAIEDIQKQAQEGLLSRFHELSKDGKIWKKAADFSELFAIPSDIDDLMASENVDNPLSNSGVVQPEPFEETTVPAEPVVEQPVVSAASESLAQWHYQQRSGSQCGPLPFAVMQNLVQQGDIGRSTLIWSNNMSDWTQAQYVPEFTSLF